MRVVLYSTGCPRCKVLKTKLEEKGIAFEECTDIECMQSMGVESVPWLQVSDGDETKMMDFVNAVHWVNCQGVRV